jgi:hypothetical protein
MSSEKKKQTLTFDTESLRNELAVLLNTEWSAAPDQQQRKIGDFKFGVYAFFDYDDEPIYVGQTNEKIRTRIRRHLTNQRTDAVAMSVLDPFEVRTVKVWPLPEFQESPTTDTEAKRHLDALESKIYELLIAKSRFNAILNEKPPPSPSTGISTPPFFEGTIVSDDVYAIRSHPDYRIARRSQVIARLAQVIAERKVQPGLRHTLLVQSRRLEWLASRRLDDFHDTNDGQPD